MKRKYFHIIILVSIFSVLFFYTVNRFNNVKNQYKSIEPVLDNYSAAEVLLLSFKRMKVTLLTSPLSSDLVVKKQIFDSKIMILEDRSRYVNSFYHNQRFMILLEKIKEQSNHLSLAISNKKPTAEFVARILSIMEDMQPNLIDLQEIIYKVQIQNFEKTKVIIEDNSSDAELFALACITLLFSLLFFFWLHIYKLKETVFKKNIFISSIYHELSSSIQKIQLSSYLIDMNKENSSVSKQIKNITFHSDKILHQTRDILEYSKIEIGNIGVETSSFYVKTLADRNVIFFRNLNNNSFSIYNSSADKLIRSDKHKLLSIITNLVDNADKNTNHGNILLNIKVLQSCIYIYVKDSGSGFDIKNLKALFRPFNQGAKKETRQGLGLGLTIIKNYVKIFNGRIRVKSKLGYGSSFLLSVPVTVLPETNKNLSNKLKK